MIGLSPFYSSPLYLCSFSSSLQHRSGSLNPVPRSSSRHLIPSFAYWVPQEPSPGQRWGLSSCSQLFLLWSFLSPSLPLTPSPLAQMDSSPSAVGVASTYALGATLPETRTRFLWYKNWVTREPLFVFCDWSQAPETMPVSVKAATSVCPQGDFCLLGPEHLEFPGLLAVETPGVSLPSHRCC